MRTIHNGNWTEWSAIWSEIIHMISKSNEHVSKVWFEIISMISDQIARPEVQLPLYYIHFEIAQCNGLNTHYKILASAIIYWAVAGFSKSETRNTFTSHLEIMSASCQCDVIGCFVLLCGWEKRCDLEQKIVQFVNKSHRWEPIRLQG